MLKEMAAAGTHEAALRLLPNNLNHQAHIADMPCGAGALAYKLLQMGFCNITCADIDLSSIDRRLSVHIMQVDLSARIDDKKEHFDCIYCLECIEHVENPYQLVRNCASMLKPGGSLIISTPNILSTTARTKFLIGGYYPHFYELAARWGEVDAAKYQAHINPIPLQTLMFMAWRNGLFIDAVDTNRFVHRWRAKDRLIALLIRKFGKRFYDRSVVSLLHSDVVLYGDILLVRFAKGG